MTKTLVIHHSADLDGIASREVARRALGDTADYLGWDYGQPLPDLAPYETVYLIDISLPVEVMEAAAEKLVLIDHHKSCIEKVAPFRNQFKGYYCIDGVAACRLAWQWFNAPEVAPVDRLPTKDDFLNHRVEEPYAIQLLGEYDVWNRRNPDVDPFQLGMQAQKDPRWDDLLKLGRVTKGASGDTMGGPAHAFYVETIIDAGRQIQAYTEVTSAQIIRERGFDVTFEGLRFRALNIARCTSMTFLAALAPEHDGCLAYFWNGKKWRFSLYHAPGKEHHDLSKIAVKYGGGGHRGAAGFELAVLPRGLGGNCEER